MGFGGVSAGVEANVGFDTQKQRKSVVFTSTNGVPFPETLKLERKLSNSISLIAGANVVGMFLFAKAGIGFSSYKTEHNTGNVIIKKTQTIPAFVPAIGAEYPVVAGLHARAEISYEMFSDKKVKALTDSVTGITSEFKHKNLRAIALKAGAVYHV